MIIEAKDDLQPHRSAWDEGRLRGGRRPLKQMCLRTRLQLYWHLRTTGSTKRQTATSLNRSFGRQI